MMGQAASHRMSTRADRYQADPQYYALLENVLFTKGEVLPSKVISGFCPKGAAVKDIDGVAPPEGGEKGQLHAGVLRVFGPFRVVRDDGLDVTPGGALRQAILAVLATSKGQIKSRRALQDMFWGHETPDRASANLRTAIYQLRQDLKLLGPEVLVADRHAISLAPGRIDVSTRQADDGFFLEGLDLGMVGTEVFEDWLREKRLEDTGEERPLVRKPDQQAPPIIASPSRHLAIGVLPPAYPDQVADRLWVADRMLDALLRYVTQTTTLDIHDLRLTDQRSNSLPVESGKGATHWVQALVDPAPTGVSIRLRLIEGGTRRLLWMSDPVIGETGEDDQLGYLQGEPLITCLMAAAKSDTVPDLFPITALAALFSLDHAQITSTETVLQNMASENRPIIDCLRLFAQVFKVHENLGDEVRIDFDGLCSRLTSLSSSDRSLPLCQSLLGYSMHMLSGDAEMAANLVEAADERAPFLSINLDHMAVMRLVKGDVEGAEKALTRCLRTGAFSPWRYTYEVTGAMVNLAKGDVRQSLFHANQALFRQPRYLAALRYSMVGFAMGGNAPDARRMHARIKALRPNFDLSTWADGLLRRTPAPLGKTLIAGLQQSELI